MGFYGNITNTSNTTFSFDRIYPNRLSMDANVNNDGIFIGRYVLVEYERNAAYPVVYTKVVGGNLQFYSSPKCEDITRIKFGTGSDEIDENDIVKSYPEGTDSTTVDGGEWPINIDNVKFYRCTGSEKVEETYYAIFSEITDKNDVFGQKSDYILNYAIDENHYYPQDEAERRTYKGYDSTVWVKSSVEQNGKLITKYVNIADLNSVVPTFDIAADAPTMTPITPHFDADSTNVYYKLHMQSPYGFRVKQGVKEQSDDDTTWYKTTYNKEKDETKTEIVYDGPADIYYNQAGFNPETPSKVSNKAKDNYIKLEPTGESGAVYAHGGQAKDIQEFSLHLPAIGNMMSDAWDIIHGPLRNDDMRQYLTNEEGKMLDKDGNITEDESKAVKVDSLQGRLNSITAIEKNQIPIKRINNGQLVGTKINGDIHSTITDNFDASIIKDDFTQDDAWIKTQVNADNTPNAISIHHTFNSTPNSTSQVDKNDNTKNQGGENYKEVYLEDKTNVVEEHKDKIKLYVPYVDAAGHVVGKNIETVTLPYGYKTITTNGRGNDTDEANDGEQSLQASVVADSTQDSLALNSGNKWIRIDTDADNDEVVFSHDVHKISKTDNTTTDLNDSTQYNDMTDGNTVIIPDWDFDKAGHITEKHNRTYTLPFGYKHITIANNGNTVTAAPGTATGTQTAGNTQGTLTLDSSNKWIVLDKTNNNDIVKFGHLHSELSAGLHALNVQEPKFGKTFNIQTFTTDNAGHLVDKGVETVKIPQPTIIDESTENIMIDLTLDETEGKFTVHRKNLGSLKLKDYTAINGSRPNQISGEDTLQSALGKLETTIENLEYPDIDNTTQFVSKVVQVDGKIEVKRANVGTLTLTDYSQGSDMGDINSGDTINKAFAKLQNQISHEEKRINTILNGTEDTTEALDTFIELQDYIKTHGTEAKNMVESINTIYKIENGVESGKLIDKTNALDIRINKLNSSVNATSGKYISSIKIENDSLSIGETALPTYILTTGDNNGQIKFNNTNINIKGLGSAAYTESSAYLDATTYAAKIEALEKRIEELEAKVNPDPETPVEGE